MPQHGHDIQDHPNGLVSVCDQSPAIHYAFIGRRRVALLPATVALPGTVARTSFRRLSTDSLALCERRVTPRIAGHEAVDFDRYVGLHISRSYTRTVGVSGFCTDAEWSQFEPGYLSDSFRHMREPDVGVVCHPLSDDLQQRMNLS